MVIMFIVGVFIDCFLVGCIVFFGLIVIIGGMFVLI